MKNLILIPFITIFLASGLYAQSNYNDYKEKDKTSIFYDDFSVNSFGWYVGGDGLRIYKFENGYYELISTTAGQYTNINLNINNGFTVDQNKDFELESSIMFVSGEDNNANQFFWGQASNQADRFIFGISGNGQFVIRKFINNTWIDIKAWEPSKLLKKNDFNKLTVRKVGNDFYFFINEGYIYQCPFERFYGQQAGWQSNQNSTMRIDYVKFSYLNKQQAIDLDYTAPAISLYEPLAEKGTKIDSKSKQILVRGKAIDKSGIYEVKINETDANVNANGDFQLNVKLAIGDNLINIKASDTKNNTATFTFNVNRISELVNDNVVVIDNPGTVNEKRLALVIGNSNYGGGQTLKNPSNDANLISTTLQGLGFEVIKRIDANKQAMEQAIRNFSKKLPNCNVALFYYAGHGLQVDGMNYLIPTDAKLNDKSDCKFEAISVNYVVEEFEKYPDNVNIVILDACRNDPFRSWARGGERGFKAISPTSGTIISFATSEGSTASDGTGNNGLFTEELVKQLIIPQPIENVFKKTRLQVQKRSNGGQSPQEWSQLTGDFYFKK